MDNGIANSVALMRIQIFKTQRNPENGSKTEVILMRPSMNVLFLVFTGMTKSLYPQKNEQIGVLSSSSLESTDHKSH